MIHLLLFCLLATSGTPVPIIQDRSGTYTPRPENPWVAKEKKVMCPHPWSPPKKKAPQPVPYLD